MVPPDEQADPHHLDLLPAAVPGADGQRDLPPVLQGRRARQGPSQPPGDRGVASPASGARSWSAATPSPRACESDDQYEFQRHYPQPFKYAPLTGWFSYFGQTGLERSQNDVLSGDDSVLFVTRLVDLLSNSRPRAAASSSPSTRRPRTPCSTGSAALGEGVQARGRGDRAEHRPDPGDELAADVRPQRAGLPRLRRRREARRGARGGRRPSRCSTARSRPGCLPARRSRS